MNKTNQELHDEMEGIIADVRARLRKQELTREHSTSIFCTDNELSFLTESPDDQHIRAARIADEYRKDKLRMETPSFPQRAAEDGRI